MSNNSAAITFGIDPDVFRARTANISYLATLEEIFTNIEQYALTFAVDGGEIEEEYIEIYNDLIEQRPDDEIALQLLKYILMPEFDKRCCIDTTLTLRQRELIDRLDCKTPVEPQLLGWVANAKKSKVPDLRLVLLDSDEASNSKRYRAISLARVRNLLRNEWPWFKVAFASDTAFKNPTLFDEMDDHEKSREFEKEVGLYLQDKRIYLRCVNSPFPKKIDGVDIGDIDIFGYDEHDPDILIVLIGECKLRTEGKESKLLITADEVRKLCIRISKIQDHDLIKKRAKGRKVVIEGLFVSNALDLEDDAKTMMTDHNIKYYQAKLSTGWTKDKHWRIISLNELSSLNHDLS